MKQSPQQQSVHRPAEPARCSPTSGSPSGHRSAGAHMSKMEKEKRSITLKCSQSAITVLIVLLLDVVNTAKIGFRNQP